MAEDATLRHKWFESSWETQYFGAPAESSCFGRIETGNSYGRKVGMVRYGDIPAYTTQGSTSLDSSINVASDGAYKRCLHYVKDQYEEWYENYTDSAIVIGTRDSTGYGYDIDEFDGSATFNNATVTTSGDQNSAGWTWNYLFSQSHSITTNTDSEVEITDTRIMGYDDGENPPWRGYKSRIVVHWTSGRTSATYRGYAATIYRDADAGGGYWTRGDGGVAYQLFDGAGNAVETYPFDGVETDPYDVIDGSNPDITVGYKCVTAGTTWKCGETHWVFGKDCGVKPSSNYYPNTDGFSDATWAIDRYQYSPNGTKSMDLQTAQPPHTLTEEQLCFLTELDYANYNGGKGYVVNHL